AGAAADPPSSPSPSPVAACVSADVPAVSWVVAAVPTAPSSEPAVEPPSASSEPPQAARERDRVPAASSVVQRVPVVVGMVVLLPSRAGTGRWRDRVTGPSWHRALDAGWFGAQAGAVLKWLAPCPPRSKVPHVERQRPLPAPRHRRPVRHGRRRAGDQDLGGLRR